MKIEAFHRQVEETLREKSTKYSPLEIAAVEFLGSEDSGVDGILEVGWKDRIVPFRFQMKARSAPSAVRSIVGQMRDRISSASVRQRWPLMVVPYISSALYDMLMDEDISALDLNGNYLIQTPDLLAIRLDRSNEFTESKAIKKVYSYNSSIVGRFLLCGPDFPQRVGEIHEEIERLGGEISLSTVSKVLSGMEEDLILEKSRSKGVKLLQPRRLLDNLRSEYREPRVGQTVRLKLPEDKAERRSLLEDRLDDVWMWTGESSAELYSAAAMTRSRSFFTRDQAVARKLAEFEDDRFYNCVAVQTDDAFVYFARNDQWASDVETCLALSQLDKRERETADQIAQRILRRFE